MAQFGRPDAVITNDGAWTDEGGGSTTIYDGIDETSPNDSDFVQSPLAPVDDPVVFGISTVEDPVSSSGHVIRYRYAKSAAGGAQIDLTVQLRQGYVSEASQGTLIEEWIHTNISETLTTAQQTLGGTEADSITDYSDLSLRFVADQV